MSHAETLELAEFHGDGISAELSASVHKMAEFLPLNVIFHAVDLSLERRRENADRRKHGL